MMRRIITTMAVALCLTAHTHAQSFLDHLQDGEKGKGSVSVKQSDDISKLVNGSSKQNDAETGKSNREDKSRQDNRTTEPSRNRYESQSSREYSSTREDEERDKARRERERKKRQAIREQKLKEYEENPSMSDTRLKVMSNSKKVSGYRVQVFAGGNTREDRAKAQEIGNKLKVDMPGQPIYVHFYSPRWCCRFGNFRRQEDANNILKKVKKLGYKNACVIKTFITVNR